MDILRLFRFSTACFISEHNNGNSSTAATINWSNGNKQRITLTANTTLTISTPPGVGEYKLRLIQDATGGRTVTFSGISSSRWWGSASQPAFNTAANGETLIAFYYDGTNFSQGAGIPGQASGGGSGIAAAEYYARQTHFYYGDHL